MLSKTRCRLLSLRGRTVSASTVALFAVASLVAVAVALLASDALAAGPPVGLGTANNFAVLAGQTVTNSGPSTINGDLGVAPGTALTGFPPGTVNGTLHPADAVSARAQSELTAAYDDAAGRTPPRPAPADLGGRTLTAGVYQSGSSLGLTGTLTLDARGDPNAVFVFQAASTLTAATASHVNLINSAQPCNVFWQVGSSATLRTSSVFAGNIMALTSISMSDAVTVQGRALARNGAVTLINDTINAAQCALGTIGGGGAPASGVPVRVAQVPVPAPILNQSINVAVQSGRVKVKAPGASKYVELSGPSSVLVDSRIDTRHGAVIVRSALPHEAVQSAVFHGGLFDARQPRGAGGLIELALRGAQPGCAAKRARATAAVLRRKPIRRLWGRDNNGRYRTRGAGSVTTVRGTAWYVEDRCDGTLTRVRKGSVSVRDSRRHRSVIVRAGHSYLARAER
jgi:hypothetical protein